MAIIDLDKWQEIFASMQRNRLRTAMTAFGVFWGILILVVLLAFGTALQAGAAATIGGFGSSQIYVWGGRTTLPYRGMRPGRRVRYQNSDIPIVQHVEGVDLVAPRISLGGFRSPSNVSHNGKTGGFKVLGDHPSWGIIQPFEYFEGRFINQSDIDNKRKVAVIGEQVYDILFAKGEPAVGKSILIHNVHFLVVGRVHSTRSGNSADEDASTVYIPLSTFQSAFNQGDSIHWFALTAQEGYTATEVYDNVVAELRQHKGVHPKDSQAVRGYNAAEEAQKVDRLFGGIRYFMWFVGLATLFAGMLGVSNIMVIVVRERTKEIGIRKALGATPWTIVSQIMMESVLLTMLSGYAGLVCAVALTEFLGGLVEGSDLPLGRPEIDFTVAIIATAILVVAGALAGFVPARHAAAISPVEALRAE